MEEINEMTTKLVGYPAFAYWFFFISPDAAELFDKNVRNRTIIHFWRHIY